MHLTDHDQITLASIETLRAAGFALHWLRPRKKKPIAKEWSESPVASLQDLRRTHERGNNLGVRLGEVSRVGALYLHVLDIDIRIADLADEAMATLGKLLPGIKLDALPCVASGSGGASQHLYFCTDKPFRSKKLATSDGKHRRERDGNVGWSYDWEIELFGTGKQVVMPPSVHPDTGKRYQWVRPFDFDMIELGLEDWPTIPSAMLQSLAVVEDATFAYEEREPLTFKPGQFERTLGDISVSDLDYDDWIRLGQAIHHQTGGSIDGFETWLRYTRTSSKFVGEKQVREMRRVKWPSFGKYRGKPVTMATVVEWAQAARVAEMRDAFDDLDDDLDDDDDSGSDFDDLLGGGEAKSDLDLLGGGDDENENDVMASLAGSSSDWLTLLDYNEEGAIKPTLHNVRLIVENDPRTAGLMSFNEFTQEVVQRGEPGVKPNRRKNSAKPTLQLEGQTWRMRDATNGDFWTEDKDNAIRAVIEAPKTQGGYGIKVPDRDLRAAIDIVGRKHSFHPVREYIATLEWDGKTRVDRLFVDYLGAPEDPYHLEVARLMLVAAVARVHEPGIKFDSAVILEGVQGKRKSTFISVLAKDWFVELDGDVTDTKQMVEVLQGAWIAELNELGGIVKSDVRHTKAFISRRSDKVRLAYAKRAQVYHRQSVLIGSTNDQVYLRDQTGGRRFLPVRCDIEGEIDTDRLREEVDQIWAEAAHYYREMRRTTRGPLPLYIRNPAARGIAERLQESRKVEVSEDALAGRIEEWLNAPVVNGSLDEDYDRNGDPVLRNEVCLLQLWCDCLGRDEAQYTGMWPAALGRAMRMIPGWKESARRPRFGKFGQQRAFEREGWVSDTVLPKRT